MRLFGHPVHPLLTPFPTALLPMDLALCVLYYTTGNASFYQAGAYCLWAGTGTGLLAMMTGMIDLLAIPRSNKPALALALYHGFVNGLIILIFCIVAYRSWQVFPSPNLVGMPGMMVKGGLVLSLFVGNYLGGRLIYQHRVGTRSNKRNRS